VTTHQKNSKKWNENQLKKERNTPAT